MTGLLVGVGVDVEEADEDGDIEEGSVSVVG